MFSGTDGFHINLIGKFEIKKRELEKNNKKEHNKIKPRKL